MHFFNVPWRRVFVVPVGACLFDHVTTARRMGKMIIGFHPSQALLSFFSKSRRFVALVSRNNNRIHP